jgi:hypothetical protein
MKFSMKQKGDFNPAEDIDLDAAKLALQRVASRRARSFARAMTDGLHEAAAQAEQVRAVNDDVSESFLRAKKDADHVQFVAHDESHSQVGDRTLTELVVEVSDEPTPSGRDPEVAARAFEFGSVAMDTPATGFSLIVEEKQRQAAQNDMREVAEVLE